MIGQGEESAKGQRSMRPLRAVCLKVPVWMSDEIKYSFSCTIKPDAAQKTGDQPKKLTGGSRFLFF